MKMQAVRKQRYKHKLLLKEKALRFNVTIKKDYPLYIMLIPFVLWYLIFVYRPMWGLQIAFKDYNLFQGMGKSPWVGFANFTTFLSGPYFWRLLRNTFIIGVYGIIFTFPASIILALMLNEVKNRTYKKSIQTVMYLPHFISTVVVAGMVTNMLSTSTGVVNVLLNKMGMGSVYFLIQPRYFRTIYTVMKIWQSCGYSAIIYVAALSAIDMQLYEACVIDGGGKFHQIRHITLPGIMPTVIVMLIMSIGNILSVGYESIILLYQPATYETADVISTYVYRAGLRDGNYGVATAVGLFDAVIGLTFVAAANKISKVVVGHSLW